MKYPIINREACGYCGACVSVCPTNALELVDIYVRQNLELCTGCLACVKVCPVGAIRLDGSSGGAEMVGQSTNNSQQHFPAKDLEVDVLVVGAGPGGSMAAKSAAEQGAQVLMIEKRQEIGTPVRCAEGVSKRALAELVELDQKWICDELIGGRVYSPDGNSKGRSSIERWEPWQLRQEHWSG